MWRPVEAGGLEGPGDQALHRCSGSRGVELWPWRPEAAAVALCRGPPPWPATVAFRHGKCCPWLSLGGAGGRAAATNVDLPTGADLVTQASQALTTLSFCVLWGPTSQALEGAWGVPGAGVWPKGSFPSRGAGTQGRSPCGEGPSGREARRASALAP